jgi:predicted O-linked N-acetylglucosamine transferase (SPINDLY family)
MSRLSATQLLFIARQHYDAGRLAEAGELCRKILADDPKCAAALHLAGLTAEGRGSGEVAAEFMRRAAAAVPLDPAVHADLARICRRIGQIEQAIAAWRRALELAPHHFDSLCGLAVALREQGRVSEAIDIGRRALQCQPQSAAVMIQLGDALQADNQFDAAGEMYRQALAVRPDHAEILLKLAGLLQQTGRIHEAMTAFQAVVAAQPQSAEGFRRLGAAQRHMGRLGEAADSLARACAVDPQDATTFVRLGNILTDLGNPEGAAAAYIRALTLKPADQDLYARMGDDAADESELDAALALCAAALARAAESAQHCCTIAGGFQRRRYVDAAITLYRRALELEQNHLVALNNLSLAMKDAGRLDEAIDCCRRAVAAHPDVSACHGNLLYTLHFHPASTSPSLLAEHRLWAARHAQPLAPQIHGDGNDFASEEVADITLPGEKIRAPVPAAHVTGRRLRIGYVSPDFNVHPVGRFLGPLLANHDHEEFEIICYASVRRPDAMTDRLQKLADGWVPAGHLSDAALASRIRDDRIDILVDLTMHMADSRLLTFARKPAPVQIAYLAYCSTTGLAAIDYRITDPYLDPADGDDRDDAERSARLPRTYWCYEPVIETPPVNALPAISNGCVTFASLNNFCKVSPAALSLWTKLLLAAPDSRLLLHALRGAHRAGVLEHFAAAGVDPGRVRFFDMLTLPEYYTLHHGIDLALDPFPYPGGTTTCDALWMGVPTVSLHGKAAFTRSGLSILSNAGVPELAVGTESQYLETAVSLAGDFPRLAQLRATLRERMRNSPLMDGPQFARDVEAIYVARAARP